MRRNKMLLTNQVREKLTGKCVTAIIAEAFINALPFDKGELAIEAANLTNYAVNVIDKMHPETLLDRAIESTANDPMKNMYVKNLHTTIESIVNDATKRIVQESYSSDIPTPELVAQIKLNNDETEKFVAASKHNGIDAVAKLVKDKMIDVIKDEKSAYETAAKIREEIKEVIKTEQGDLKTSTAEDGAIESYLNLILAPTDARNHISVFSKMQDVCMEAILYSNEKYFGEIPYDTLEKITLESTFPFFDLSNRTLMDELNTMLIVTESTAEMNPEDGDGKKKIAKTAFICTICIMTLLETLKTMNLAKPGMDDVRKFVDDPTNIKNIVRTDLKNVEDKVTAAVSDVKKSVALGSYQTVELAQAKESLEKVRNIINGMTVTESEMSRKNRIINQINTALESIKPVSGKENPIIGHFTARLKEENIVNLEHAIKLISQSSIVSEIQITIRSDIKCSENSMVDVEVKGNDINGRCVATYTMSIHALPEFGDTLAEVIRDSANYCNLGAKPVKMYFTDAGYSVPLKG